jgi:hypothetical protein
MGLRLSVIDPPTVAGGPEGYGWSGGFGTVRVNDPEEDLVHVLGTEVLSPTEGALEATFWSAAYQALEG